MQGYFGKWSPLVFCSGCQSLSAFLMGSQQTPREPPPGEVIPLSTSSCVNSHTHTHTRTDIRTITSNKMRSGPRRGKCSLSRSRSQRKQKTIFSVFEKVLGLVKKQWGRSKDVNTFNKSRCCLFSGWERSEENRACPSSFALRVASVVHPLVNPLLGSFCQH